MARTITPAPTRKVLAGGVGAGLGQYLGDVVLYTIERLAGDLPSNIDSAVVGIVAIACSIALAYLVPPATDEGVV